MSCILCCTWRRLDFKKANVDRKYTSNSPQLLPQRPLDAHLARKCSPACTKPYVRKRIARSLESFGGAGPIDEKVEGPMEEDGKGDIDGDGISDSEDEEPRIADDKPNYSSMTVAELKKVLKEKGLSVSGKKADLISRLEE